MEKLDILVKDFNNMKLRERNLKILFKLIMLFCIIGVFFTLTMYILKLEKELMEFSTLILTLVGSMTCINYLLLDGIYIKKTTRKMKTIKEVKDKVIKEQINTIKNEMLKEKYRNQKAEEY